MLTAIDRENNQKIIASPDLERKGSYYCQMCSTALLLKKGRVKIPHFAHVPRGLKCDYVGESLVHLQMKKGIYNYLKREIPNAALIELEKPLGFARPDVFIQNKYKIAIEVQASKLTVEQILQRTLNYSQNNIFVLWVLPFAEERLYSFKPFFGEHRASIVKMKEYEKVIYKMFWNNLIFFDPEGAYGPFVIIKYSESYSPEREYYDSDGEYQSHVPKPYSTYKEPRQINLRANILQFRPEMSRSGTAPTLKYKLPEVKIFNYKWPE